MFQSALFIFVVALAFCLTPGVFLRLPAKGKLYQVAFIHALLFTLILMSTYSLFLLKESFEKGTKKKKPSSNKKKPSSNKKKPSSNKKKPSSNKKKPLLNKKKTRPSKNSTRSSTSSKGTANSNDGTLNINRNGPLGRIMAGRIVSGENQPGSAVKPAGSAVKPAGSAVKPAKK